MSYERGKKHLELREGGRGKKQKGTRRPGAGEINRGKSGQTRGIPKRPQGDWVSLEGTVKAKSWKRRIADRAIV